MAPPLSRWIARWRESADPHVGLDSILAGARPDAPAADRLAWLRDLSAWLRAGLADDPGIAAVGAPRVDANAGVATIVATPTTAPQDPATRATVERLRHDVLPGAVEGSPATAHVGGQTAVFLDVSGRIGDRLALFVAAVVGLSFLLLVAVRSRRCCSATRWRRSSTCWASALPSAWS